MLTEDDIHILVDIVIVDPTWANLFPQFCATQGFVAFNATQAEKQNYPDWHLVDQFLPLVLGLESTPFN